MTVVLVVAGVIGLIFLPPFVTETIRGQLMEAFAPLCHQIPERSFTIGGIPLAVGHRCTGIYVGLLGGVVVVPLLFPWKDLLRKKSPWLLLGLLLVLGIDWMGPPAGAWMNTPASRVIAGLLFGWGAGYYMGEGLTQLFEPIFRRRVITENVAS